MSDPPSAAPAASAPEFEERHWTSVDGLRLYCRDYPGSSERPPLLCLHGLTRNSRDFEDFAARHAGRFRVLTVDFRGRGNSERDPQPERYLRITYAADVLQLLDIMEIPRAIFVGTSLGGLVTMLVAGMQPQRVEAAILNDIGPDLDPRGIDRITTYVGKPMRFADWEEAGAYAADIHSGLPASFARSDWIRFARRLCREDGGAIVFDYDMAIADAFSRPEPAEPFDMWPLFQVLARRPLLLVRGEKSDLLAPQTVARMAECGQEVAVVTVTGVGHAPTLEEPEAVAAIDRFLGRWD